MHLGLPVPGLSDEGLAALARATAASLRDLDIGGHARVGDAGLAALAECAKLTRVRAGGCLGRFAEKRQRVVPARLC